MKSFFRGILFLVIIILCCITRLFQALAERRLYTLQIRYNRRKVRWERILKWLCARENALEKKLNLF